MSPLLLSWASCYKFSLHCLALWSCLIPTAVCTLFIIATHHPSYPSRLKLNSLCDFLTDPYIKWSLSFLSSISSLSLPVMFLVLFTFHEWDSHFYLRCFRTPWTVNILETRSKKVSSWIPALPFSISLILYKLLYYQWKGAKDSCLKGILGEFNEIMCISVLWLKSISLCLAALEHVRNTESRTHCLKSSFTITSG